MRISWRVRYTGAPFSSGGVLRGVKRCERTIDEESMSTTLIMLSACKPQISNNLKVITTRPQELTRKILHISINLEVCVCMYDISLEKTFILKTFLQYPKM